jgi:hypothetical protein
VFIWRPTGGRLRTYYLTVQIRRSVAGWAFATDPVLRAVKWTFSLRIRPPVMMSTNSNAVGGAARQRNGLRRAQCCDRWDRRHGVGIKVRLVYPFLMSSWSSGASGA